MKTENVWALNHCTPATWTVELTPPASWDYERDAGERLNDELNGFFALVGRSFSAYGEALSVAFKPFVQLVEGVSYHIAPILDEMHSHVSVMKELEEGELVKNGRHIVKSQNPRIELPIRYTNSGPPERRKRK